VGLTAFFTVCAILLFYDTLFGSHAVIRFGAKLSAALNPILYGALLAYLLAPVVDFFDGRLFPAAVRKAKERGKYCAAAPRAVSLILTWVLIVIALWVLFSVLFPEVYRSVLQLWANMENYYNTINRWITRLLEENPGAEAWATEKAAAYYNDLLSILTDRVMPQAQQIMTAVSGGIMTALAILKDMVVGAIVSIYLLATKERCAAHGRKLAYGLLDDRQIPWFFQGVHRIDGIFSGFIRGKLLDSLIIGVLCFICSRILDFPYAPLVSVIVGITNVIPFFGPFLGAVPSLFLILLADPVKALYFLIFIIALQQLDGNVIGPKILGNQTGLSGLWVIIAILVGGSFFGVAGMFFGVPVCACLQSLGAFLVNLRLKRRGLPTHSVSYQTDTPNAQPVSTPQKAEKT
jgi:predicted PurR-regulated permease PerM